MQNDDLCTRNGRRNNFPNMGEGRRVLEKLVVEKHLSYFVERADKTRSDFRCFLARTPHSVPVRFEYTCREISLEVTEHNCPRDTHAQFRGQNRQRYLRPQLEALVINERTIAPPTLVNIERSFFGNYVRHKWLQRARDTILTTVDGQAQPGKEVEVDHLAGGLGSVISGRKREWCRIERLGKGAVRHEACWLLETTVSTMSSLSMLDHCEQ